MKQKMVRLLSLLLSLVMVAGLATFGMAASEDYDQVIAFVHTNDVHGYVDILAYVPSVAAALRAEYGQDNVIVASAGDDWAGLNIATLTQGESVVPIMNAAGYQIMALGNNDQNFGIARAAELAGMCGFPVLCANLVSAETGKAVLDSTYTFDCNGVKVGMFSLCPTMPDRDGYTVTDGYEAAAACVSALEAESCDLIVALTHIGFGDNYEVSSDKLSSKVSGIDLIIDGHSHTVLENGYVSEDTGVTVAQTGEYGNYIGVTKLFLKDGAVVKTTAELLSTETYTANYTPDAAVQAIIDEKNAALETITAQVVGSTDVLLDGSRPGIRSAETNLGSLCADAVRWATGADIALVPGVKIRASVEAGDITMGDLLNVFANGGEFYMEQLTGAQLKSMLTVACSYLPNQDMRYQHVSGMSYTYSIQDTGNVIESMTYADGTPIGDDDLINVAFETAVDLLGLDPTVYEPVFEGQADLAANVLLAYMNSDAYTVPSGAEGRAVEVAATAAPAPVETAPTFQSYTVVAGDCLWNIAKTFYGDGFQWSLILNANSQIKNADLIYVGQVLTIPEKN